MSESGSKNLARCEACGHSYRVPSAGRTYDCKACDGTVRAVEGEVAETEPILGLEPTTAEARFEANEALKGAYKRITAVTWLYRLGALAYAIATLFAVLALAQPEVPVGAGTLVACLTTLMSVLMLMGALHILFHPIGWTVAIAVMATGVSVVHLVGPNPLDLALIGSATLALLAWAALVPAMRFGHLITTHKDLYILHHSSAQTRRSLKGRTPAERHERLLRAMRRAARRAWKVSTAAAVMVCMAAFLGSYSVLHTLRPHEFEAARASFERAWNGGDLAAVQAFYDPRVRDRESAWLTGALQGHGWSDALPVLQKPRQQDEVGGKRVDYVVADQSMSAEWWKTGVEWKLARLEIPMPPLEPALERFLKSWRASHVEGLASFFSEENRASMQEKLEGAFQRRLWSTLPPIGSIDVGEHQDGQTLVVLSLESGDITTKWHLRDDASWGVHGILFPKR